MKFALNFAIIGRISRMPIGRAVGAMQRPHEQSRCKESTLNSKAGVWLDHREAVIVMTGAPDEHSVRVLSNVEKHPLRTGDSPLKGAYESRQVPADDKRQRALTGELNHYYDAIIAAMGDAQSLLIFGPGEAKGELKRRLESKGLGSRVAAIETVDKMTDLQIGAKVRQYFSAS
jgi:hypothetical protein